MAAPSQREKSFSWSRSTDQAIAGFTAGAVGTITMHPLDVIKTRFQINETKNKNSIIALIKKIIKNEGVAAFYRGISPNFVGATASWGLFFLWYDLAKVQIEGNSKAEKLGPTQHLIASSFSGVLTTVLLNPIWVIKTRMVTQRPSDAAAYKGLIDGLKTVYKTEGFRGFYKGLTPALFGVTHGALQVTFYEYLKNARAQYYHGDVEQMNTLELISFAAISKTFAAVCCYPYQVIKSRLQVQHEYVEHRYTGVKNTITSICRREGIRGFYKGLGVNVIRVLPGTCVTFAVYEAMSKFFRQSAN